MKPGKENKKIHGIGEVPHVVTGLKALSESGARYVLVGGIAANLHGLVRATKDIDVLIPKDLDNTRKILKALENLTWGISRELDAEEVILKPFTIIGDMPRVDLLLRAGKLTFEEGYARRIQRTIDGISVPYVSAEDLIRSKLTNRPHDKLDIENLKRLQAIKKK